MLPYGNFPVLTLLCEALPLSYLRIWVALWMSMGYVFGLRGSREASVRTI